MNIFLLANYLHPTSYFAGFDLKPGNCSVDLTWTTDKTKAVQYTQAQLDKLKGSMSHASHKLQRMTVPLELKPA